MNFANSDPVKASGSVNTQIKLAISNGGKIDFSAVNNIASIINTPSYEIAPGRYEQTSSFVSYNGACFASSDKTFNFSNTKNDYVEFYFIGTSVKFYSLTAYNKGIVEIYIDGKLDKSVDTYSSARKSNVLLFEKTGLTSDKNTIKLVVSGNKMPSLLALLPALMLSFLVIGSSDYL